MKAAILIAIVTSSGAEMWAMAVSNHPKTFLSFFMLSTPLQCTRMPHRGETSLIYIFYNIIVLLSMRYNVLMDNDSRKVAKNNMVVIGGKKLPLWRLFLYITIGCFSFDALMGILFILFPQLFAASEVVLRVVATTSILGLFCLLTMNNILRRESKDRFIRISATVAMIVNIFWLIPWILIVWNSFDGLMDRCDSPTYPYYSYRSSESERREARRQYEERERQYNLCMKSYRNAIEISWKLIGDGIVIAIFFTGLANYLAINSRSKAVVATKTTALVTGSILALFLVAEITFNGLSIDATTSKMLAILGIIFIFCVIMVPILVRSEKRKSGKNEMAGNDISGTDEVEVAQVPKRVTEEGELRRRIELELRGQIEAELREKIEKEVRAQIEAEYKAKNN